MTSYRTCGGFHRVAGILPPSHGGPGRPMTTARPGHIFGKGGHDMMVRADVMVRVGVRGWIRYNVYESPHKDGRSRMCVLCMRD